MWRRIQKFLATFIPSLILLLYIGVVVCLLNRWDSMVAITLIPFWVWAGVSIFACLLCWLICRGLPSIIVFLIWLVTAVVIAEETHGLFRELVNSIDPKEEPAPEEMLRVVNIHANEKEEAFKNLADLDPDIVIVQNSPDEAIIAKLSESLYGMGGTHLVGGTHAILARGEFLDTLAPPTSSAIHARLRLKEGFLIDITSLELAPCLPRYSLWNPKTWETLSWIRMQNRRQLRTHLGENQITRSNTARLVAGGFNTPPGDDVFRPLESNDLVDAFTKSGEGWGNTFPAEYSYLRLDQIWASKVLEPVRTVTRINPESDHRTVVSDFRINPPSE